MTKKHLNLISILIRGWLQRTKNSILVWYLFDFLNSISIEPDISGIRQELADNRIFKIQTPILLMLSISNNIPYLTKDILKYLYLILKGLQVVLYSLFMMIKNCRKSLFFASSEYFGGSQRKKILLLSVIYSFLYQYWLCQLNQQIKYKMSYFH